MCNKKKCRVKCHNYLAQLWPKIAPITAKQTVSRKTQPIRRPLSLCSSVAALRPDMLTCDNMFISLKDSEELPLSLLRGLWWLALERSAAVTTEQHGLGRPDDEVKEPPICWWVWKMKNNCLKIISQHFFNTSYLTDSYISSTLKLKSRQKFCSNSSIRSSTYGKINISNFPQCGKMVIFITEIVIFFKISK